MMKRNSILLKSQEKREKSYHFQLKRCILRIMVSLLFTVLFLSETNAQITVFSADKDKYQAELIAFMQDVDKKSEKDKSKAFIESFPIEWNDPKYTQTHRDWMYKLSNLMLNNKFRPYPQFEAYLDVMAVIAEKSKDLNSFIAWSKTVEKILEKRNSSRKFLDFMDFSMRLYTDNYIYFSSRTNQWKSSNSNFYFEFIDEKEPVLHFPSLTLICYNHNDSSVIYNTSGKYFPFDEKWQGKGGKIDWQRAGFSPDLVYAEIDNYNINLKYAHFTIDTVKFYHKEYFDIPMYGSLSEKVLASQTPEKASYPYFVSFESSYYIENIFKDIDYEGGFTLQGSKFRGSGNDKKKAALMFKREGEVFVKTTANTFIIRKDRILSDRASVAIYWESDSIYHVGLQMKYLNDERTLSLIRLKEGLTQSPFMDTYHKVDMYVEVMSWRMNEPKIDFTMIKGPGNLGQALFESANYYSSMRFDELQGIDMIHPLVFIRNSTRENKSRMLSIQDLMRTMRTDRMNAENQVIRLAKMGFLLYDIENEQVYVKDKVFDYLNAKAGQVDYDVIQFHSQITAQDNATLNLLNFDLKLRGISRVALSDSQRVFIYPTEQEITLKENRDFSFSGRVHAGRFDFHGSNFDFYYDQFKIEMPIIDSMTFKVRSKQPNEYGYFPLVKVKNVIEDLRGNLLIDHPNNKSGLKPFQSYSIFNCFNDPFVYYDSKKILGGAYERDKFYYHMKPFTIDSLNTFEADALKFEGYLNSGGIFPDIEKDIGVMDDYSLGFKTRTPVEGLPMYGGKATFKNNITLSNNGLRGDGVMEFLHSTTESDDFIFYPDRTTTIAKNYQLKEMKGELPNVEAQNVEQVFDPEKSALIIRQTKEPIVMYREEDDSYFEGELMYSTLGLEGDGRMNIKDADIDSRHFIFKDRIFDCDTADFKMKTLDDANLAFETKNYKAHVDYDERKADFKSNGGTSLVNFPLNQYICYMDRFEWYMDKEEIALANELDKQPEGMDNMDLKEIAELDLSGSEFISVHPAQDSLRFFSSQAKYSLKDNIIYATDVKIIKVADAAIYPGDREVTILKKAEMLPLKDAQILANTVTKYHILNKANVNILGRLDYRGNAYYEYVDEMESMQEIFFDEIKVDSSLQTVASGRVADTASFTLSPYFDYAGNVKLQASKEFLYFKGMTRIKHDCFAKDSVRNAWVRFETEINPKDIYIPIGEEIENHDFKKVYAGIYVANDSLQVYSAFLRTWHKYSDTEIISASGFLTYDKESHEYRISTKEKLKQLNLPDKYLSLSVLKCMTRGEGQLSLGANLGQVEMTAFGRVDHHIIPDSTDIRMLMFLDFFFKKECLEMLADDIASYGDLEPVSLTGEIYTKSLGLIFGMEEADKIITELNLYGELEKIPKELQHTMTIADVELTWNSKTKSYITMGKIGIGAIGDKQLNRYVNGAIEIQRHRSGDRFTIYLELSSSHYYYFSYRRGLMEAYSSKDVFNKLITDTDADARRMKVGSGEQSYAYYISTKRRVESFLKKLRNAEMEEEEVE